MAPSSNPRVKLNLRVLPFVVALLAITQLLWAERAWMILLVALASIWLLDFLWARALKRGLAFQRELRYDWAHVGDELEERFTLTNSAWAPALWVEILDHSNLPDYGASVATGVESHAETAWRLRHICTRRGIFNIGPTTLRTGTPFNLYTLTFELDARSALMVMPSILSLPGIEVAPGGRAHEGKRRASSLERTVNASGLREYVPGDSFKTIHWRTVAHHDELFVRTFDSTPAGDWWIWLDLDENVQAGSGEDSTVEHAVLLAASFAARGLGDGRAVGLGVNARAPLWLAPRAGEAQRLEILRALATVEAGTSSLAALLKPGHPALYRNQSVIVITPAVEGAWLDAVLPLLSSGATPTILLLDRATYGGTGNADRVLALLTEWNIAHELITRDVIELSRAPAPRQGHWEWTVGATGRAIARSTPREQEWRTLS